MNYNLDMYLSDLKIYVYIKLLPMGTSEMAQWVKVLATKPNKLSLVLRTHMVEGEKWSNKLSSNLNMHNMAQEYMYVCLHMLINLENKNNKNNCP